MLLTKRFVDTSMDLRRDKKRSLKFREMLETKDTHKPRMQKRGDKEKPIQREGTQFKMCAIDIRSISADRNFTVYLDSTVS